MVFDRETGNRNFFWCGQAKILEKSELELETLPKETLVYPSKLTTTRRPEEETQYYSTDVRSRITVDGDHPVQFLSFLAEKRKKLETSSPISPRIC